MKWKGKMIILIGGAPTAGKSEMAKLLSNYFKIPWISTDQIRDMIREVSNKKTLPKLHNSQGYDAEKFLTTFSAKEIVKMEIEQGESIWPAVKKLINEDYNWEEGFIIEGVHLIPKLIKKDFSQNKNIKVIFLIDEDVDRTREVIFKRGLWDDADKYSDKVKEKEVEWALLFSQTIKKAAVTQGFPCVEVRKHKEDIRFVLEALKLK